MTGQTRDQMFPWLKHLQGIADKIVNTLHVKELTYGGSWQKRGGQGAFMMLARKWDRIENMATESHYDLFGLVGRNQGDIIDDIDDLIGYLLLTRAKVKAEQLSDADKKMIEHMGEEPGPGYVNQDPDIASGQPSSPFTHPTGRIDWKEEDFSLPAPPKHRPLTVGKGLSGGSSEHIINTTQVE